MNWEVKFVGILCLSLALLAGCSYNPFYRDNNLTGDPAAAAAGGIVGAGGAAALGGSKTMMALAGITGAAIGYYVTTLRYESGGIIRACGQVYRVGCYTGIYIPTDRLFEPNTDELLPQSGPILDSVVTVLQRNPDNNILISGNTSGFNHARWEQQLSERRAQKVAAYLWNAGVNAFKCRSNNLRKLTYVGYGDYLPIANSYTNEGIRQNSRIQITSYPSIYDLGLGKRQHTFNNYGSFEDDECCDLPGCCNSGKGCETCGEVKG